MWKDNANLTISAIAGNLRQERPDCHGMLSTVRELAVEVGKQKQNAFRQLKPGDSNTRTNQKAYETLTELEDLEAALAAKDPIKALKHAEAALRVLRFRV